MRLGIDFGTTRTLVAVADRGNYPVLSFTDPDGEASEHFPSAVAEVGGQLLYGFDALRAGRGGAPLVRSFKRALAAPDVTGSTPIRIGARELPLAELLAGYLGALRHAIVECSNLPQGKSDGNLEAVVAVPAHAHAAQRFLTLDSFRRSGFDVRAVMNEPSAAGFEYTHRQGRSITGRRSRVLVYDLGGGTFDASLVRVTGGHHDVLATSGLNRLGGDDFDEALVALALEASGASTRTLSSTERLALFEACREAKERLTPTSKRLAIDAGALSATVKVDAYYAAVGPLVERTLEALRPLVGRLEDGAAALEDVAGVYLVGGASGLPLVPRLLKQVFGRRVHRSPYPAASAAIGLAIAADETAGFTLTERFSRSFGVFRERADGRAVSFDPILAPEVELPPSGVTVVRRRYRAAHNLGHFRFVECRALDQSGEPAGDLVPFGEVLFPFDTALRDAGDLRGVPVERSGEGTLVEERYLIDPNGLVEVEIECLGSGYQRSFPLGVS